MVGKCEIVGVVGKWCAHGMHESGEHLVDLCEHLLSVMHDDIQVHVEVEGWEGISRRI